MLYPAAAVSFGLFLAGVLFAYYCVLPPTLYYFFNYSKSLIGGRSGASGSISHSPRNLSYPSASPLSCRWPCCCS